MYACVCAHVYVCALQDTAYSLHLHSPALDRHYSRFQHCACAVCVDGRLYEHVCEHVCGYQYDEDYTAYLLHNISLCVRGGVFEFGTSVSSSHFGNSV